MSDINMAEYNLWIKHNPDLVEQFTGKQDCPECDGTGEATCYVCGNEHECKVCEGTGKVDIDTSAELMKFFKVKHEQDEKKLSVWKKSVL